MGRQLTGDEQHIRDIELLVEVAKGYGVEIEAPKTPSIAITATRILEKMADRTQDSVIRAANLGAYKDCHRYNGCTCEKYVDSKYNRCYIGACIWDLEQETMGHGKSRATAS